MTAPEPQPAGPRPSTRRLLFACAGLSLLLALLLPRRPDATPADPGASATSPALDPAASNAARDRLLARLPARRPAAAPRTAAEIVAGKVSQFGANRREVARRMAGHFRVSVPPEMERFFDAVEAGSWEEVQSIYESLLQIHRGDHAPEGLQTLWPVVAETFGVAGITRDWPPQQLLSYGQAILDSLPPGAVYVGGTDSGRFIPTLLNETSGGERHLILTQNALADSSYLKYLGFLHQDQLQTLTGDDSQRAFRNYIQDAQRRLHHDRDYPDAPRQLRPGEDVRLVDNRVQVSGKVAVMSINELLLRTLLGNNPKATFVVEESHPLRSTYAGALPRGPLMELGTPGPERALTAEHTAQALDYWRNAARQFQADPSEFASPEVQKSWAQLATAQANLFASQNHAAAAEQAYALARQMAPASPDPVRHWAEHLAQTGRIAEAVQLLDNFALQHPGQRQTLDLTRASVRRLAGAP